MTTIAFLGAGNIAQAIMGGLIENGFAPGAMTACDPVAACQDRAREKGIIVADSNDAAVESADVILLCVKPNVMLEMLSSLSVPLTGKLLISVAAGITTNAMTRELPAGTAIVRCMPNTPALVQTGMTAMFATSDVTAGQQQQAENILSAAVTAVSGSGPAYFFLMMESMIDAGIKEGLDRHTASQLVLQTALGAARMAIENPADPGTLRQQVTSPGGTTQAAIEYFQAAGFEKIVSGAVGAARARSIELSGEG